MNDINPFFAVTVVVFAVYVAMAILGSREQGSAAPLRMRRLRVLLQHWVHNLYPRK